MSDSRQSTGRWGESQAAQYLAKKGYQVVARNVRTEYGEIDLVAQHQQILVFTEVKTRTSQAYGLPEEAITPLKMQHMIDSAMAFLQQHPEHVGDWRIDVISVQKRIGGAPLITHFENVTL
jgi:putative endonuclease